MLYALIGSGLFGALASAFLLWRKSVVERNLAACEGQLKTTQNEAESWKSIYQTSVKAATDREIQLTEKASRLDSELAKMKGQRDAALDQLVKSGAPGSLADLLRAHAKV